MQKLKLQLAFITKMGLLKLQLKKKKSIFFWVIIAEHFVKQNKKPYVYKVIRCVCGGMFSNKFTRYPKQDTVFQSFHKRIAPSSLVANLLHIFSLSLI